MADFDDIEFDRQPAPTLLPPPASSGPPIWPIAAGTGLLAVALGALWYFGGRDKPAPAAPRAVPQTTVELPRKPGEAGEAIDLPPLDQTDGVVRMLVGKLSSHPSV